MKRNKPDYRRDAKNMIAQNKWGASFLIAQLGISLNTYYRWKRGETSPTEYQIKKMRELEIGRTAHPEAHPVEKAVALGNIEDMFNRIFEKISERLSGRFDQLTAQIADLQHKDGETKGEMKARIEIFERDVGKLVNNLNSRLLDVENRLGGVGQGRDAEKKPPDAEKRARSA